MVCVYNFKYGWLKMRNRSGIENAIFVNIYNFKQNTS